MNEEIRDPSPAEESAAKPVRRAVRKPAPKPVAPSAARPTARTAARPATRVRTATVRTRPATKRPANSRAVAQDAAHGAAEARRLPVRLLGQGLHLVRGSAEREDVVGQVARRSLKVADRSLNGMVKRIHTAKKVALTGVNGASRVLVTGVNGARKATVDSINNMVKVSVNVLSDLREQVTVQ